MSTSVAHATSVIISQGQGNGLVSLDGSGLFHARNPAFYIRGIQSSSGSTPLFIVDGVERAIENVVAEDVESVSILKDAAATALYGCKGANGVVLITTKHGKYNTKSVTFSYDHVFSFLTNKPKMVDAATYASAVNEAYHNQNAGDVYSSDVINAYRDGSNPLYYPNVNWADETLPAMFPTTIASMLNSREVPATSVIIPTCSC